MQHIEIEWIIKIIPLQFANLGKKRVFLRGVYLQKNKGMRENEPLICTNPTLFGWDFVLVHQVFDVDSHAEDGAGVDKDLTEEHQHRSVYLACGRKCQ